MHYHYVLSDVCCGLKLEKEHNVKNMKQQSFLKILSYLSTPPNYEKIQKTDFRSMCEPS